MRRARCLAWMLLVFAAGHGAADELLVGGDSAVGSPLASSLAETHRNLVLSFAGAQGWTPRWVKGGRPASLAESAIAWVLPGRQVYALESLEDGSARDSGFLPLYPVRLVILENRRLRLRNENQLFGGRVVLARGGETEALVNDLEGRYGNTFELKWVASPEEAVRAVKTGQCAFTFLDSDLALMAASGDPDVQVSWRWLESLASVRLVGWTSAEGERAVSEARWEKPLIIRWSQWLGDRQGGAPWKALSRAWDLPYANYLSLAGAATRAADVSCQAWRNREGNARFEARLDRLAATNLEARLGVWGPVLIDYLSWANPFEVRLADLDLLHGVAGREAGEWLDQAKKKAPLVWDRWTSLRGAASNWGGARNEPTTLFESALTPEDRRAIQRLFWRKQGETLMRAGKFDEACSLFERVVMEDPEDQLTRKQLQESTQRRDAQKREAALRLSLLAAREAARAATARGDELRALEAWRRVLAVIPGDPEARRETAALRQQRQERERREELERLGNMLEQGLALYNAGHPEKAIPFLESLLDLAPGNAKAQEYLELARGALAMAGDEVEDAKSPYRELVANLQSRARATERTGRFQESEEEWRRILALFPKNREALAGSLRCHEKQVPGSLRRWADGRLEEAARLRKEQHGAEAQSIMDLVRTLVPDHPGLLKSAPKRIQAQEPEKPKADPQAIQRLYDEAMTAYGREDLASAREIYRSILAMDSNQVSARLFQDRIETRLLFGVATNAVPHSVDNSGREDLLRRLHQHALDLYNQGRVQDAVTEWERIVKLDPSDKRAQNSIRRAQALRRQQ